MNNFEELLSQWPEDKRSSRREAGYRDIWKDWKGDVEGKTLFLANIQRDLQNYLERERERQEQREAQLATLGAVAEEEEDTSSDLLADSEESSEDEFARSMAAKWASSSSEDSEEDPEVAENFREQMQALIDEGILTEEELQLQQEGSDESKVLGKDMFAGLPEEEDQAEEEDLDEMMALLQSEEEEEEDEEEEDIPSFDTPPSFEVPSFDAPPPGYEEEEEEEEEEVFSGIVILPEWNKFGTQLKDGETIIFRKDGEEEWIEAKVIDDRVYYPHQGEGHVGEVQHVTMTNKGNINFGIGPDGMNSGFRPDEVVTPRMEGAGALGGNLAQGLSSDDVRITSVDPRVASTDPLEGVSSESEEEEELFSGIVILPGWGKFGTNLQDGEIIIFQKNGEDEWTEAKVRDDRVYYPHQGGGHVGEVHHISMTNKGNINFGIGPDGMNSGFRPDKVMTPRNDRRCWRRRSTRFKFR